jgi:hypothetical protein
MSSEEIAKDILVAAIQAGIITKAAPSGTALAQNNELTSESIAGAYKTIYNAVDSVYQTTRNY